MQREDSKAASKGAGRGMRARNLGGEQRKDREGPCTPGLGRTPYLGGTGGLRLAEQRTWLEHVPGEDP